MNLATNLDTAMPATFEPASTSLPERVRQGIDLLKTIITEQHTSIVLVYSGGKDSTVVVSIALTALAELAQEGRQQADIEHLVVTSNTGIENPVI
tara:strand:+ start:494 stop:778 length:285 start_codon:yes stop_codon:yes gene_type:complete